MTNSPSSSPSGRVPRDLAPGNFGPGSSVPPLALSGLNPPSRPGLFDGVTPAPVDPIFGVLAGFRADRREEKVNLGIGVYCGPSGLTEPLEVVKKAEAQLAQRHERPGYLQPSGHAEFCSGIEALVLGTESIASRQGRVLVRQALGGTGALRLAGDLLSEVLGVQQIAVSRPTWENHANVFSLAGFKVVDYPYYSPERRGLDFEAMLNGIKALPPRSALLLHGCCHNPTGVDPSAAQWHQIMATVGERALIPVLDFAYQGFGRGMHEDALSAKLFAASGLPFFVAQSCSKNFALYEKRTGAMIFVAENQADIALAAGHVQRLIRGTYSNPPADGARIVAHILSNNNLCGDWAVEVRAMRDHVDQMRQRLVEGLKSRGVDFSYGLEQRGIFMYPEFSPGQPERLRAERAVYVLDSGRLCVPALNARNIDYVVDSIAATA